MHRIEMDISPRFVASAVVSNSHTDTFAIYKADDANLRVCVCSRLFAYLLLLLFVPNVAYMSHSLNVFVCASDDSNFWWAEFRVRISLETTFFAYIRIDDFGTEYFIHEWGQLNHSQKHTLSLI